MNFIGLLLVGSTRSSSRPCAATSHECHFWAGFSHRFADDAPMKAVWFVEKGRVAVEDRPRPSIQDATDAVVRITKTAICGSDLHFYHGRIPMAAGFVVGHEMLGIVEDVGQDARPPQPGNSVVGPDL